MRVTVTKARVCCDSITLKPDQRIAYRDEWETPKSRIAGVRKLMEQIAGLAA